MPVQFLIADHHWIKMKQDIPRHTKSSQKMTLLHQLINTGIKITICPTDPSDTSMHFSLAMSADGKLVATGQMGKDAYITVWDSFTCQPVSVIHDGHSHSVTSLAFSSDGSVSAGLW